MLQTGYQQCLLHSPELGRSLSIVLAVSGGADSMILLHASLQLLQYPESRLQGAQLHVAHINHQLRGTESDSDEQLIQQLCNQWQVPCTTRTVNVHRIHEQSTHESLEETARRVRYEHLLDIAANLNASYVVTAHHRDDQAETILHNILRGTGLRGLAGIVPSRELGPKIRLLRPMLDINRSMIMQYLEHANLQFREDATNQDPGFLRNRIRHRLLPLLRSDFNAQTEQHLVSLGSQAADALQCLDQLADRLLRESVLEQTPDSCRLDRSALKQWPDFLISHTLTRLWAIQHWPQQQMTVRHWRQLAQMVRESTPTSVSLPANINAVVRTNLLHLQRAGI